MYRSGSRKAACLVLCAIGMSSIESIAAAPVSPSASPEAKVVLNYLYEQFGKKTLSGQMYAPWAALDETELVHNATGKHPAIRGQDLITESANNKEMQQAIAWWKAGGISTVTFSVSRERFQKIRSRIKEMRSEILALVRTDSDPVEVYHLAVELFPATRKVEP